MTVLIEEPAEPGETQPRPPTTRHSHQAADVMLYGTGRADSTRYAAAKNTSISELFAEVDLGISSQSTASPNWASVTPSDVANAVTTASEATNLETPEEAESQPQTQPSTDLYNQISYSEFEGTVRSFAQSQFHCDPGNIRVYHMHGGSYNRIVGLDISDVDDGGSSSSSSSSRSDGLGKYVLRIPRFSTLKTDISAEVAILKFLRQQTQVPAPHVVAFSTDDHFLLNSPFAVQKLMPGTNLYQVFPKLDFDSKARLARNVAESLVEMLRVQSSTAGWIVFANPYDEVDSQGGRIRPVSRFPSTSGSTEVGVKPFAGVKKPGEPETKIEIETDVVDGSQPPDPIHAMIVAMLQEKKREYSEHTGSEIYRMDQMDKFSDMILELHRLGCLTPHGDGSGSDRSRGNYRLAHLDFAARNILVDFAAPEPKSVITAVLDWDSAVMAPVFVACQPPAWLWMDWDGEEGMEDEYGFGEEYQFTIDMDDILPTSEDGRALKQIFDDTVGAEYCRYAYSEAYRLARRIFHFAKDGIASPEDFDNTDLVMDRWPALQAELKLSSPKGKAPL